MTSTGTDRGPRAATTATIALIVVSGLLRIIAARSVGLGLGEAYYFAAAKHLSLSYFDQPPAAAFLAWLSLRLAGTVSDFVLRAPFVLLFAGTTWLMYLTGRRLFGPWAGFLAALLLNVTPVFALSTGIFFQPEGPLMFFWLATLYFLAPVLLGDATGGAARRDWLAAGAMLGLALLSKYTAVFLGIGAVIWLLLRRDRREWLRRPEPYLAVAVALLCFAPVLVWNAQHHWISFRWQGDRGTVWHGIHLDWLWHNVSGQILEIFPWIWILLVVEPFRAWRGPVGDHAARRMLLCFALPPILAFTAVAAYANIGNHFHWGTPGYLTLLLGLGATFERAFRRARAVPALVIGTIVAASLAGMVLVNVQAVTGRFSSGFGAVSRWLSAGNDATIELIDYDALDSAFRERGLLDRPGLFVFSDRWYVGGKVDYALRGRLPFLLLNRSDPREYAFFDSPARWVGREGILVSRRGELSQVAADYAGYCSGLDSLGSV
ncbi:MAG: glycosyltransferase family 39 protein, partial [Gemmatimonadales bacterium]